MYSRFTVHFIGITSSYVAFEKHNLTPEPF